MGRISQPFPDSQQLSQGKRFPFSKETQHTLKVASAATKAVKLVLQTAAGKRCERPVSITWLPGGRGFLRRRAPSGGKNHSCPNESKSTRGTRPGSVKTSWEVGCHPTELLHCAPMQYSPCAPAHCLPWSVCPACPLALPELQGSDPFSFGHL